MAKNSESYAKAIAEIETIITEIEEQQPDMDQLSSKVSRALELIKSCRTKLKNTEEDIDKLLENLPE
ncbi:MAG: exodeoxyribonuclease VII small subunit [Bacteroidales bacterium]|jgi:exodeoxyribonuclease VII small subunit|nr:exodeoxyribonuclease VII small subunit [Bacteroidales bacterium]